MSKLSYRAAAMKDAMEIACQILEVYGDDALTEGFLKLRDERRLPYDHAAFQAAYAAICQERGLPNQYFTLRELDHG